LGRYALYLVSFYNNPVMYVELRNNDDSMLIMCVKYSARSSYISTSVGLEGGPDPLKMCSWGQSIF